MKKLFYIIPFISLSILTSCHVNHQTNELNSGTYFTNDYSCRLEIKEISYEEYETANKVNVIEDHSIERIHDYYSFELYIYNEDKWNIQTINNMHYSGVTTTEPCIYAFDEGSLGYDTFTYFLYYNEKSYNFKKIVPNYTLTFKCVDDKGNILEEMQDNDNYIYKFTYKYGYVLNDSDNDEIFTTITKDLPMPGGGYWTIGGYYSSLDKDEINLEYNYIDYNHTIYYTWIGGPASPEL